MMNDSHKYSLEHYHGLGSRHQCPNCGDAHSFALYVDGEGNPLDLSVGRCNHESGCGYHKTPSQFFAEHPEMKPSRERNDSFRLTPYLSPLRNHIPTTKPIGTIPIDFVKRSKSLGNSFITFLSKIFDADSIINVAEKYSLGATKAGDVIFWQIDCKGCVRSGKIIKYNSQTGHRIKEGWGQVDWIHFRMKRMGLLPQSWELSQCLFGEHLISADDSREKTIALVESEKSAIIGALQFPQYIWMATGGIGNLNQLRMNPLIGRTVIIFPDVDGMDKWREKASKIIGCRIIVSDILEKNATEAERAAKIDIADWIVGCRMNGIVKPSGQTPTQPSQTTPTQPSSPQPEWSDKGIPHLEHQATNEETELFQRMMEKSPSLKMFASDLDLGIIGMKVSDKAKESAKNIVNNNLKTINYAI